MNDGTGAVTSNENWNINFVAFNQQEYPNFDNSALLFGYGLTNHYFIPNDYTKKGEYPLYIYAEDNAKDTVTPSNNIKRSSCTQNLYDPSNPSDPLYIAN